MREMRFSGGENAGRPACRRGTALSLRWTTAIVALTVVALLGGSALLFAQHSSTGSAGLAVQVNPADLLTITGGTTVSLAIRLGTGPAYLWGDSTNTCTSPIGTATTISTSGTYSVPLASVPFISDAYVCVYSPSTSSLNTSAVWPHTVSSLAFGQQPSTTTAGNAISPAVTVKVLDSNGVIVTGDTSSVTIGINGGGVFAGTSTLTVAAVSGVATFSNLVPTMSGSFTLSATDGSLAGATSNSFTVNAAAAKTLVFTTQPSGGANSTAFPVQPAVTIEDTYGNTVTSSSASITLAIGNNPGSFSTLSGCTNPLAASSGVASFTGCEISDSLFGSLADGDGYTLTAMSSGLTTATSAPFDITGSATTVSKPTVGAQTPNPVEYGSSATYAISAIASQQGACTETLSLSGTALPAGATASISPNTVSFTGGTPQASTLTISTTGSTPVGTTTGITVTAAGSAGCTNTQTSSSFSFVVSAGLANAGTSTVSASPTSVAANGSTTSTVTVTLKDVNSNPVAGKTVTLAAGSGNSTISAASGPSSASGVVTFTVTDTTAQAVIYTATDASDSVTITQTAAVTFTASRLTITSVNGGSNPTAGTGFSVVVQSQDANGNMANVINNTAVTLSLNTGTGTLGGTLTGTITAGTSSVTITGVTYTKAQSGVILNATRTSGDSLTAGTSAAFTVNSGATSASKSSVNMSPSSVTANGVATSTITVTLLDANSNPVIGDTVTLAQGSGSSSISAASGPSNSSGVVTFTVTDIVAQAVTYTATDTTDSNLVITDTAIVTFTASKLAFTSAPFSVAAGSCSSQVTVQTQDGSGNATDPASTVTVALSSSSTGTKAFYSNSGCTNAVTSVTIATSANSASFYYKDTQAGSPIITAAATGGVTSSPTQTETVTAGTPSASKSTVNMSPNSVPADGATTSTITVTLLDANSNPVSGKTVTLTAGSGNSVISAASGASNAAGVVTFTVTDTHAQAVTYTGKDTSDNVTITDTAVVTFTASKLVFTTSPFTISTTSCSSEITVQTQDANGDATDPASTVTVALSSSSTGTYHFYSNSSCGNIITSATINTSGNSANFYYKDNKTGSPVITAAGTGGVTSSPTQTETVN